jgi:NAD(P)-dependent dehydrogenase (short-subunit alcohol dehydrogenase family)
MLNMFIQGLEMKKTVLIVGGSSGIGLETANYLSNGDKWRVIVCGLERIISEEIYSIETDIRSNSAVNSLYNDIIDKYGDVHALVYTVGISTKIKPIEQFDEQIWQNIIDTNVTGLLRVLKKFHKSLKITKGRVVVVNSIAGKSYSKYSGFEYTASKAALSGIVRQLAMEWSHEGVLINSIFPSMTMSPMLRNHLDDVQIRAIEESLPLKKLATSTDTARAIEFLLAAENRYITGSGIDVSGGLILNG